MKTQLYRELVCIVKRKFRISIPMDRMEQQEIVNRELMKFVNDNLVFRIDDVEVLEARDYEEIENEVKWVEIGGRK